MSKHLLSLSDLNAAAPGVLIVVFGKDGDHEDAPRWLPLMFYPESPIKWGRLHNWYSTGHVWIETNRHANVLMSSVFLDLRVPSIAARLLALLRRLNVQSRFTRAAIRASTNRHLSGTWTESDAAHLGEVVLYLAPQIAALTETT